ncbi:MAG: hypothetical protein JSS83_06095 [Cyanobacteria bacterium SZAS LIN-3]|nr:hypothetical protein [Cyanobacteria bacterium SZAS LIN-3]
MTANVNPSTVSIRSVCADIAIRQGEGPNLEVSPQTPGFWKITGDGSITEIGGPVAEALNEKPSGNRMVSFSSGWVDGVFYVNNRKVDVPDPREQLVVYLPAGFTGNLEIEAEYFGAISIEAALAGKVKARVSSRVSLEIVDQKTLAGAKFVASTGGSIRAGVLVSVEGKVKVEVSTGSVITVGDIRCAELSASAGTGGKVNGKNVRCTGDVDLEASTGGSRVEFANVSGASVRNAASTGGRVVGKLVSGRRSVDLEASTSSTVHLADVWTPALDLEASTSGSINLDNADVFALNARASMSSEITVGKGSAEQGKANASMSGVIELNGEFGSVDRKESMSGKVRIKSVVGDAGDRFVRAARRHYNTDLADDVFASSIALIIVASMAPGLQQGMAEALADETFVSLVCKAMRPTLRDPAFLTAIRACGAAFGEAVGAVENLSDQALVLAAFQTPAVSGLFGPAFQIFLQHAMEHAQKLV